MQQDKILYHKFSNSYLVNVNADLGRNIGPEVGSHVGVHVAEAVEGAQAQVEQEAAADGELTRQTP
jgi:hypothetical protein